MTPKEKAKYLVSKYSLFVYPFLGSAMLTNTEDREVILANSKKCAIIAVDEIYNLELKIGAHLEDFEDKQNWYSYWEEVKDEIAKTRLD